MEEIKVDILISLIVGCGMCLFWIGIYFAKTEKVRHRKTDVRRALRDWYEGDE